MNEDYTLLTKIILANFQDQITPAQRINQKFIAFDSVFYVFFFKLWITMQRMITLRNIQEQTTLFTLKKIKQNNKWYIFYIYLHIAIYLPRWKIYPNSTYSLFF